MSFTAAIQSHSYRRPSVQEIRKIFPTAYAVGIILPLLGQGLHIEFNNRANLFDELGLQVGRSSAAYAPKLFSLAKTFGFINLKNCDVPVTTQSSNLSQGMNAHGKFVQDPFHRDVHPLHSEYVTVMVRDQANEGRHEPTFYATEPDVREAIRQLPRDGLSTEVVGALAQMECPDYRFRLFDEHERKARDVIQTAFPEFTQAVFDLIPEQRKYSKTWKADVADIAIHSNMSGQFLHARPTGSVVGRQYSNPKNPVRGLEIYHG